MQLFYASRHRVEGQPAHLSPLPFQLDLMKSKSHSHILTCRGGARLDPAGASSAAIRSGRTLLPSGSGSSSTVLVGGSRGVVGHGQIQPGQARPQPDPASPSSPPRATGQVWWASGTPRRRPTRGRSWPDQAGASSAVTRSGQAPPPLHARRGKFSKAGGGSTVRGQCGHIVGGSTVRGQCGPSFFLFSIQFVATGDVGPATAVFFFKLHMGSGERPL